jgi:hypothetical protein
VLTGATVVTSEDVDGFKGTVELRKLHQLHLLNLIFVSGNVDPTLDYGLDLVHSQFDDFGTGASNEGV